MRKQGKVTENDWGEMLNEVLRWWHMTWALDSAKTQPALWEELLGRGIRQGKCLLSESQIPPPPHSPSTFSMAILTSQVAIFMVLGRADVPGGQLALPIVSLPDLMLSIPPVALMSQGFAQFPPLPTKPFESFPIRRAIFLLWSPEAVIWHLLSLLPYISRCHITMNLSLLPHALSFPIPI